MRNEKKSIEICRRLKIEDSRKNVFFLWIFNLPSAIEDREESNIICFGGDVGVFVFED